MRVAKRAEEEPGNLLPPGDDAGGEAACGALRCRSPDRPDGRESGHLTSPSSVSEVNRRISTLVVALVPIVAFGLLLAAVTVPFVSVGPGPIFDTLGEVDGKQVVDIQGTQTHPTTGRLSMTTVSQRDELSLAEALALWLSGQEQLMPRDLLYPPGKSRDEIDKANNADFEQSEHNAEYAALGYLKYPQAVTVAVVSDPGPSMGKLQAGDAVDAVNGAPVANVDQLMSSLKTTKPGQSVAIGFRRKNAPPGVAQITLGSHPDRESGVLGVSVMDAPWAPFIVDFNLANVGGPSAGLMFSLAVVDKLTTGDLAGSNFVAGTGTIKADGAVGRIGGIAHKLTAARAAGATVFLVPTENCYEASSNNQPGLQLVKVGNLGEAVDALHTVTSGGQPPRC
jgi:Lon-like protease